MSSILLFLSMMIPITWSPGPNNIMCATVGGKKGVLKSIPFIMGVNLPIFLYSLATGFGLGIALQKAPFLIDGLKYAGGIYVLYLGWKIFTSDVDNISIKSEFRFIDGFIISALNAKIITALVLMYSQFMSVESEKTYLVFLLSISFVSLCVFGHFMWAITGDLASKLFQTPKALKVQNYIFSFMLFVVGIWIFIS